jgi:hypothetical protein
MGMVFKNIRYVIIAVAILFICLGLFYVSTFFAKPKQQYTYNMSSQTVIKELRELNRLETASFTIEKVIDAGTSGNTFQQFLYGDRILLIAHGQIIAGIDMAKLGDKDVSVSGQSITIKLPAPEILVTTLDNGQTRVYDRRQGLLTKGDNNLESNARIAAVDAITNAACKGNILQAASDNAKKQLTAFLKALRFTTISIEIPQGNC